MSMNEYTEWGFEYAKCPYCNDTNTSIRTGADAICYAECHSCKAFFAYEELTAYRSRKITREENNNINFELNKFGMFSKFKT